MQFFFISLALNILPWACFVILYSELWVQLNNDNTQNRLKSGGEPEVYLNRHKIFVPGSFLSFVFQHLSFNPAVLFSATVHFQTLSHCIMASNRVKGWWVSHARSAPSSGVNLYSLSALHLPLLLPPLPPEPDGPQAIRRTNENVTAIHGGAPSPTRSAWDIY